jgi:endopeptidase Clp ATP-binding regulatory subunit ClpX
MTDKRIQCGDEDRKSYPGYTGQVPLGSIFASPQADTLGEKEQKSDKEKNKINFDMKPEELEAYLKQYVVKQEKAVEVLATKVCTHFQCLKIADKQPEVGAIKNNIIMIGPTGVGKTYLVKLIAKKIGVPFVKADATKFSETGYVGGDVEQLVRDLVHEAGDNIAWAENGIIYIDEIDKIATSQGYAGPDVSRTGVQRNLLKLLEETEVDLKIPHDLTSQLEAAMKFQKTGKIERKKVNTKNILFVVSGAFGGLEEIIGKRLNQATMGFKKTESENLSGGMLFREVKAEDLIQYGFESEFVGRLPVIAVLEQLDENDLFQILSNPHCPIVLSKKRDFKAYGIDIKFEPEALRAIAAIAGEERTGARGLVSAMERVLLRYEKKLPSSPI